MAPLTWRACEIWKDVRYMIQVHDLDVKDVIQVCDPDVRFVTYMRDPDVMDVIRD